MCTPRSMAAPSARTSAVPVSIPSSRVSPILKPTIWQPGAMPMRKVPGRVRLREQGRHGSNGRDAVQLRRVREVGSDDARHVRAVRAGVDTQRGPRAVGRNLRQGPDRVNLRQGPDRVQARQAAGRQEQSTSAGNSAEKLRGRRMVERPHSAEPSPLVSSPPTATSTAKLHSVSAPLAASAASSVPYLPSTLEESSEKARGRSRVETALLVPGHRNGASRAA